LPAPLPCCRLSQELELKQHSLALLEERVQGSEAHQLSQATTACEEQVGEAQEAVAAAKAKKAAMVGAAKELERDIANFGKEKDKHVKAAQAKVKAAKAGVEGAKKKLKAAQAALQGAVTEAEAAQGERAVLAEQLAAAQAAAAELEAAVSELAGVVAAGKAAYDERAGRLEELRARLKECDAEIAAAGKARGALEQRKTDIIVEKKKMGNRCAARPRVSCCLAAFLPCLDRVAAATWAEC
jgi:structural maintenance of chromosome 2